MVVEKVGLNCTITQEFYEYTYMKMGQIADSYT